MDKKIGIAVSGAAAFTILVIVLTFVTIITIETKQKIALGLQNSTNETSSASKLGKYWIYSDNINMNHITFAKRLKQGH